MAATAFGQWLKQRRRAFGYTQEVLAQRIGYSVASIRKLEDGSRPPSRQIAELLGQHLDVPAAERVAYLRAAREGAAPPGCNSAPALLPSSPTLAPAEVARGLPAVPFAPLTPLIGREPMLAAICRQLVSGSARLLTLTGPPGVGKTGLAVEVANRLAGRFADGMFFVNLAPVRDPDLLPAAIAQVLGLQETTGRPFERVLSEHLRGRQLLLILDNYEHLMPAAPGLTALLVVCPAVQALVTSREALHLRGEQIVIVPPLDVPDLTNLPPLAGLRRCPAIRLFVERATSVNPEFHLTEDNAAAAAAICAQLQGLPLAIELVAARTRLLPLSEIVARLGHRLSLLVGGPRDLPARQQTLRGAIEWSYHLLEPDERQLLARLGVFVGGATYSAIEAVCNGTGDLRSDVLISLDSLLRKSLLRREPTAGEPRVAMLETIREYALERLTAGGDAATLHRLHAEYFLAMAEAAEPQLAGDERKLWLAQLERDHDNLRAALAWMAAHGEVEMEARLAGSLGSFWQIHGHVPEGRRRLYAVFARSARVAAPLRARVLLEAGNLAAHESDYHEAVNLYQESLGLFGAAGDGRTCGYLLYGLAKVLDALGDTAGALTALRQGLVLSRGSGDLAVAASTLNMLGTLTFYYSAADEGIAYYEESLALYREAGDKLGASNVLNNLGEVARLRDDYAAAAALYEESLVACRDLDDPLGIAIGLDNLGQIALHQSDYGHAQALFTESLQLCRRLGRKKTIAICLGGLAGVAAAQAAPVRAAHLCGAAEVILEAIRLPLAPADAVEYDRHKAIARAQLPPTVWEAAIAEGRAMPTEQAVDYALAS